MRFVMKLILIPACGAVCLALCSYAQQTAQPSSVQAPPPPVQMPAPTSNDTLKSVEIRPDRHVRFQIWAPNAIEVKLHAEGPEATPNFTPEEANKGADGVPLVKGEQGIWQAVIG